MREFILGFIASWIIRVLSWTYRYELHFTSDKDRDYFNIGNKLKIPGTGKAFLISFFHQDELSLIPFFKNTNTGVLVSISKDGEIMTRAVKRLGYLPVRGSSSKKAVAGLIAAIKSVKAGHKFSMAVDGPKGPIYKVKKGIIAINEKTNVPILPVRSYPEKYKLFEKAWNQAKLPLPFSKIKINFGKIDAYTQESLEECLLNL